MLGFERSGWTASNFHSWAHLDSVEQIEEQLGAARQAIILDPELLMNDILFELLLKDGFPLDRAN